MASEGVVKEEKVEPDSESEATDMGYEYDSLMTDLMGGGGGEAKEHSASMEPFNQSLSQDSYSAEAGPSGLQVVRELRGTGKKRFFYTYFLLVSTLLM